MALSVHIKHAGKLYDIDLNPDLPASVFKTSIYQATGVPPDRMKVMIKGGVLKDDTDWKKVAPKTGQTFMVVGAAGELPRPPEKSIVFLEDMDDEELAEALAKPVGLRNLGNTCYMNATIQALRAVPELQVALNTSAPAQPLPKALSELYASMARTAEEVIPMAFLQVLRQVHPQFAELVRSRTGMSYYAQQDAEECYGQILNSLRDVPTLQTGANLSLLGAPEPAAGKFIEQYMMGEMRRELKCDEAPEEPMTVSAEKVLKIECNITIHTNYMLTGIMNSLDQKVEKNSPTLGRQAVYSQHSRLTRLPTYLTVHMVRFAWRADIGKKTKIMRKVRFPLELDAIDLVTDELKAKMLPVSRRLKEIEKEREERIKVRKKMKVPTGAPTGATTTGEGNEDVGHDVTTSSTSADATGTTEGEAGQDNPGGAAAGELEDEGVYRMKEVVELQKLVHPDSLNDVGCSPCGLYELVAIVTHKGAAADAGHYIGFVKKKVFHPTVSEIAGSSSAGPSRSAIDEDDEDWYKFDDERVSVFPAEKLATLDGGGEDASAYVLLYKTKSVS